MNGLIAPQAGFMRVAYEGPFRYRAGLSAALAASPVTGLIVPQAVLCLLPSRPSCPPLRSTITSNICSAPAPARDLVERPTLRDPVSSVGGARLRATWRLGVCALGAAMVARGELLGVASEPVPRRSCSLMIEIPSPAPDWLIQRYAAKIRGSGVLLILSTFNTRIAVCWRELLWAHISEKLGPFASKKRSYSSCQ